MENRVSDLLSSGVTQEYILSYLQKYLPPAIISPEYLESVLHQYLDINNLLVDIEKEDLFVDYSNPMKLYYKIKKAFELSRKQGAYDLYVRIRPDLQLDSSLDKLSLLSVYNQLKADKKKVLAHYPYIYEYYGFGVDDKLAISMYDSMSIYSKTWDYVLDKKSMKGHMDLARNLMQHDISVEAIGHGTKVKMVDYNL